MVRFGGDENVGIDSTVGVARVEEPFFRTLARNATIAAAVAVVFALLRRDPGLLLPVATLAMWFSLGGHYVEIAFLNVVRKRLPQSRVAQALARLVVWSCGGAFLYLGMATTARFLWRDIPLRWPWWFGGLLFTGIELFVHAALAIRDRPNFFDGRG